MKKPERRSEPTSAHLLPVEQAVAGGDESDRQFHRIRRVGTRLFDVADCIVVINENDGAIVPSDQTSTSVSETFCYSLPHPVALRIVPDTRNDPLFAQVPHIRFYATCPIRNQTGVIIGSINLIDFVAHIVSAEDRKLLADLAALVEREVHFRSITALQIDLEKKNKSLRRKSLMDPMLNTWNRGAIMRILTIEAIRCDKAGLPLSLIVVDLDFFKKINDTYGHPAGDAVLVSVADRLRSCIRPQEALGRYGGEEFLIVLPGASQATAMAVAERMRREVAAEPATVGKAHFQLTISAGVASTAIFPSVTTDELISRADMALYAAKDAGRNCVAQASPDLI